MCLSSPSHGFCMLLLCVCLIAQSCLTLCNIMNCNLPGSSVHGDSPGKNTGVGCLALLEVVFPTQWWKPGLQHCRQILYQTLSYYIIGEKKLHYLDFIVFLNKLWLHCISSARRCHQPSETLLLYLLLR